MKDLEKVNAAQLFAFWRNFSVGLLVMMATLVLSWLFPFYFSPIIGLLAAAVLYTMLYNNKLSADKSSCMLLPYAMFYCLILYSFTSIILNVLDIWNFVRIPKELSFFNEPYIAALLLDPICMFVMVVFYFRRNHLSVCVDCKMSKGLSIERGKLGEILHAETRIQFANMIVFFTLMTIIDWVYYYVWYYHNALVNNRDWYVFLWVNVIAFILDEIYFASRYYNIYLDLKDNGEIITEEELSDMTTKTYLRFYVICGNHVYINTRVADPSHPDRQVMDTPFVTKRNVNGITTSEVTDIVRRLTGIRDGETRFFYGRKAENTSKHRLLRYFYFLDGTPEDYADILVTGEWVDFKFLNMVYNTQPSHISRTLLTDLSRMTTVVLTQKIFNEQGERKIKTKSYQPRYDLEEVRANDYDFQDDKWIRIAMYNSDKRGFHFRKWMDKFLNLSRSNPNDRSEEWERNR